MASKSISKSVIWQLTGKFALQGIAFFTAPIFTRLLNPEDYGYTALYSSWCSIFCLIIGLMTHGSIQNARVKYEEKEINSYLSSVLSISVISFSILFIIGFILKTQLAKIFSLNENLVVLAIIQSFFAYVINFYLSKLDNFKQVEKSTIISISQSLLIVSISLIAVIFTKGNKAIARIYSASIPTIVYGLIIFAFIYKKGKTI